MTPWGKKSAVQDRQHENTDFIRVFRCASRSTLCASRSCLPTQLQPRYGLLDRTYLQSADETAVRHGGHGPDDHAQIRTVLPCVNFTG